MAKGNCEAVFAGTVSAVADGKALVVLENTSSCAGCSHSSGCNVAGMAGASPQVWVTTDGAAPEVGSAVRVALARGSRRRAVWMLLVLPLAAIVAGAVAGAAAGLSDGGCAVVSLGACAASLAVAGFLAPKDMWKLVQTSQVQK